MRPPEQATERKRYRLYSPGWGGLMASKGLSALNKENQKALQVLEERSGMSITYRSQSKYFWSGSI